MSKNNVKPEIRFKNFTDAWEQRKWIDTVDMSTNMVNPKSGIYDNLPHIGPGNIESFTGRILSNVNSVKEDNIISGKFHFKSGDIIYGKINPQLAKYAYVNFEGLASADSYVLSSKSGIDQYFLFIILQTKWFYKYSVSVSMRTGMPKINRDELNHFNYFAPSDIKEQKQIGFLFKQLDNTIALYQHELTLLKQRKKAFLQKMFPKKGELHPEIRLNKYSDEWTEVKFGDLGNTFTGLSGKTKEDFGHGEAEYITYKNVFNNYLAEETLTEHVEIDQKQNQVKYLSLIHISEPTRPY